MDIEKAIQGIRGTLVAHLELERKKGTYENMNLKLQSITKNNYYMYKL